MSGHAVAPGRRPTTARAAGAGRLTPSLLARELERLLDPQLSPDGTLVAYAARRAARDGDGTPDATACYVDELRVLDITAGGCTPLVVGEDAVGARWSPRGTHVAYVARTRDAHELRVRRLARQRGRAEPTALAGAPVALASHAGSIADLAWAPDGARLAYVAPAPEPPAGAPRPQPIERPDFLDPSGAVRPAGVARQLFLCAENGNERRRLTDGAWDHRAPAFAPDGGRIAAIVSTGAGGASQLALMTLDGSSVRHAGPPGGRVAAFAWSPRGDRLLLAGEQRAAAAGSAWDVFLADAASGDVEPLVGERAWAWGDGPVWLDDAHALLHVVEAGTSALYVLDVAAGALEAVVRGGLRRGLSVSRDGRLAVQAHEDGASTGELVAIDLERGAERTLARLNDELFERVAPVRAERRRLGDRAAPLDAWVLHPPAFDPAVRHPLVLELHGGPQWFFGERFEPRQQCLAAAGFVVAGLNPRGSDSYGRAHAAWINDRWGAELEDVLRGLDALLARPYLDPERVGLMGFSYGGYLTAWALAHSDRFAAGACGCPVFDLESWLGSSNEGPEEHGFSTTARERLDARSPSTFADRIATPTLLLHGDHDAAAPVGQSDAMYRALERVSCPVAYVRYPGAGHALLDHSPAHGEDVLARVVGWFERHLGR
jgi:dipeptidyl aminopeptidase/acylaminoacyl peptidase